MKFFYVLNNNKQLVEFGRGVSERGHLFESLINVKINETNFTPLHCHRINLNSALIEKKITEILNERNSRPLDIPDYETRFREKDVFEFKQFKGEELKLCNTGFDNRIIFLINLYNSALKSENPYYLVLADKHKQFEDMRKTI